MHERPNRPSPVVRAAVLIGPFEFIQSGFPSFLISDLHAPCCWEMSHTSVLSSFFPLCLFVKRGAGYSSAFWQGSGIVFMKWRAWILLETVDALIDHIL